MMLGRRRFLSSSACLSLIAMSGAAPQVARAQTGSATAGMKRRYVRVDGRNIYYLSAGKGPPVVLLHSSPGDSSFFLRDIPVLAAKYSVFAFDTPGFGRSDPLPEAQRDVSFLADNIAAAMRALKLPPAAIFGSHTGAAVAAELAARQPDVVRSVMLDGFPIFNEQELDSWFDGFFPPLVPDKQGGHFAAVWTRCRDQSIWFPWSYKQPDHLLGQGIAPPARIQSTMMSVMRCGRTYVPAFRSAVFYGPRAAATLARIDQPIMIAAAAGDPLSAHLDRLPPLKPNQLARKEPTGEAIRALRDQWLAQHAGNRVAPPISGKPSVDPDISAHIVELPGCVEIFMRVAGKADAPALLLIHDAPGSSRMHEPAITALSAHARVFAIDLPGCGETDPLAIEAPTTADFATVLRDVAAALGLKRFAVHGIGFGSAVALELAVRAPEMVDRLVLQSMPLPPADQRIDMAQNYAPPITLKADGSHWYATWLMLRDSLIFWPWYKNGSAESLRHVPLARAFDADHVHDWTVEVMKQYASYHHIINAALNQDALPLLHKVSGKLLLCTDAAHPFAPYDAAVRAARPDARTIQMTGDIQADVARLAQWSAA